MITVIWRLALLLGLMTSSCTAIAAEPPVLVMEKKAVSLPCVLRAYDQVLDNEWGPGDFACLSVVLPDGKELELFCSTYENIEKESQKNKKEL